MKNPQTKHLQHNFIDVLGKRHHYQFINEHLLSPDKTLLVFLHEGLGSVAQWKDFPLLLSERVNCPVLLFDRYGHGKSEKLKASRDMYFMHEQAKSFLPDLFQNLDIQNYQKILIGHSDGGSIAIIHAGSSPHKIAGIITIAAHLFLEEISLQGIRETAKLFETKIFHDFLYKYHGENTDSMFNSWAGVWLNPEFREWNIENYLSEIHVPFLALQGNNDQYGSYAQLDAINQKAEKARIEIIVNCGHIPHLQQKDNVLEIISEFIGEII